jgi:hypothetical protein
MTDWTDGSAPLAAFLGFDDLKDFLFLLLRFGVALVGAFVGWLVSGPLVRLLVRLAFQRPTSPLVLRFGRLGGAVLAGVLVFIFFHFGPGGSGGGSGGGTGPGQGPHAGRNGSPQDKKPPETQRDKAADVSPPPPGKESLTIEMILSKRYQGDGRYYLIQGKEPPRNLEEVEKYIQKRKKKEMQVEIIIYANSIAKAQPAVMDLEKLLDRYKIPRSFPEKYRKEPKPEKPEKD